MRNKEEVIQKEPVAVSQEELVQEQEEVVQENIKVDVLSTEPYKENKEHNEPVYSVEEPIEDIKDNYNPEHILPILSVSEDDNDYCDTVVYKSYKDFDSVPLSNKMEKDSVISENETNFNTRDSFINSSIQPPVTPPPSRNNNQSISLFKRVYNNFCKFLNG